MNKSCRQLPDVQKWVWGMRGIFGLNRVAECYFRAIRRLNKINIACNVLVRSNIHRRYALKCLECSFCVWEMGVNSGVNVKNMTVILVYSRYFSLYNCSMVYKGGFITSNRPENGTVRKLSSSSFTWCNKKFSVQNDENRLFFCEGFM